MKELDLIDRNDMINSIDHFIHPDGVIHKDSLLAMINILPQLKNNRYGHWMPMNDESGSCVCSECGYNLNSWQVVGKFCHECGAFMGGDKDAVD